MFSGMSSPFWRYVMNKVRHLSVRIEDNLLRKFRYACKYEDRSANGQILNFIRNFVNEFEKEHGKIELPNDDV